MPALLVIMNSPYTYARYLQGFHSAPPENDILIQYISVKLKGVDLFFSLRWFIDFSTWLA